MLPKPRVAKASLPIPGTTLLLYVAGSLSWPTAGNTETGGLTEQNHALYGRLRGGGSSYYLNNVGLVTSPSFHRHIKSINWPL